MSTPNVPHTMFKPLTTARLQVTAYGVARTYVGLEEIDGKGSNPLIEGMLKADAPWLVGGDEVPWCSAYVNFVCRGLGLPRSQKLNARSWLAVGQDVPLPNALVGFDVVVLMRGGPNQPGPKVLDAPGHVGFFAGHRQLAGRAPEVLVLAGNQGDAVTEEWFPASRILGIRRLIP